MAQPTVMLGSHLTIMIENGASPTLFIAPCGLVTKSFTIAGAVNEFNVPDCADPDAPSWTTRVISALSGTIAGSGILALESYDEWRDWSLSGEARQVHVTLNEPQAIGGGFYHFSAVLTSFETTGNQGENCTIAVEIQSNGQVFWEAGAT